MEAFKLDPLAGIRVWGGVGGGEMTRKGLGHSIVSHSQSHSLFTSKECKRER